MKKILTLTKVMSRNYLNSLKTVTNIKKTQDSKVKRILKILGFVILSVYLLGLIFVPTNLIIKNLVEWGQPSLAISALITFAPILMLYFAILSVPGVFYFSSDIEDYLPLPLKSNEIIIAKYFTAYIQTLLGSLLFFLPVFINYFILVNPGLLFILLSVITLFLIPLIPLALALMITSIIMRFLPYFKNKDLYTYFTTSLIFIPTFIIVFFMSGQDVESDMLTVIINSIQNMDDSLFRQINLFFPTSKMFIVGIVDHNLLQLVLGLIISVGLSVFAVWFMHFFYFDAVIGIDEKSSRKKRLHLSEFDRYVKKHSFKVSFMINDFKRILRTPAFAINYFSVFLIMPVMMLLPLIMQGSISNMTKALPQVTQMFHDYFYLLSSLEQLELVVGLGVVFGILIANFEASSSTAISREGLAFKNYLSLPIKLSDITHAKALFSILLSTVFGSVYVVIATLLLKPKIITFLSFIIGSYIGILFTTYVTILVDVLFPSLNWATDQEAVKGNFIQVMVILPMMFIPLGFVLLYGTLPLLLNIVILLIVLPILTFLLIKTTTKASNQNLLHKIQNI